MLKLVSFIVLSIFFLGCKDSITKEATFVNSLVDQWKIESGSLDGVPVEGWNSMLMAINTEKDSLIVNCDNQPVDGLQIWPKSSKWLYIPINEIANGDLVENKLHINSRPPREWSYKETCPNNNSSLICSEQGQWEFVLTKN